MPDTDGLKFGIYREKEQKESSTNLSARLPWRRSEIELKSQERASISFTDAILNYTTTSPAAEHFLFVASGPGAATALLISDESDAFF